MDLTDFADRKKARIIMVLVDPDSQGTFRYDELPRLAGIKVTSKWNPVSWCLKWGLIREIEHGVFEVNEESEILENFFYLCEAIKFKGEEQ